MLGNQWCLFERNHQSVFSKSQAKSQKTFLHLLWDSRPTPTETSLSACTLQATSPSQHMQAHQSCPCLTREITALESSGGLSPTSCFHSTITASQLESKALLLLLLSLENHCLFSSFATRPMPAALPYLKTAPFRTHWPRCEGEGEQDWSSALDKTWV